MTEAHAPLSITTLAALLTLTAGDAPARSPATPLVEDSTAERWEQGRPAGWTLNATVRPPVLRWRGSGGDEPFGLGFSAGSTPSYALHCSAPGKVLLAHAGEELFEELAERGFARQSRGTITDAKKLKRELAGVRERGFALDIEEYADGLMCLAAPVCDCTGEAVGVVGVSVLTLYYTRERMESECGPVVLEAARRLSPDAGREAYPDAYGLQTGNEEGNVIC